MRTIAKVFAIVGWGKFVIDIFIRRNIMNSKGHTFPISRKQAKYMSKSKKNGEQFYGTTTLGEKGQIVIPAEARKTMGIKKGEKLLVFGMGCDMLALSKLSKVEQFASHLSGRLGAIRGIIKKSK